MKKPIAIPAARTAARAIFTADLRFCLRIPSPRCSTSIHIRRSSTCSAKRTHTTHRLLTGRRARGAHEIALAAQAYTNLNLQFLMYRPWCRAARAEYFPVPKKQLRASFPVEHFCGVRLSGCEERSAADKRHGVAVWPRAPRDAPAMVKAGQAGYSRSLVQTLEV